MALAACACVLAVAVERREPIRAPTLTRWDEAAVWFVLACGTWALGLPELAGRLDAAEPWQHRLNEGARRRLMIARLLVRRPDVVVLDQALRAMHGEDGCALLAALQETIPGAVILVAGAPEPCADRFGRVLVLDAAEVGLARSVPMPRSSRVVEWIGQGLLRPR
jgi:ABC-type uncharacterized transport system fused permease/ATPase subunit